MVVTASLACVGGGDRSRQKAEQVLNVWNDFGDATFSTLNLAVKRINEAKSRALRSLDLNVVRN